MGLGLGGLGLGLGGLGVGVLYSCHVLLAAK